MKIYTRGGDTGQTSLIGARTAKDDVRVEAYGAVDELNSLSARRSASSMTAVRISRNISSRSSMSCSTAGRICPWPNRAPGRIAYMRR